ncbi:MAG: decarboxylase, partial [Ruminococcus sp.]
MKMFDYFENYLKKDIYPFHMPGNKRVGDINRFDFTEVEGLDNLYHPEGIIQQSMDRIKSLYQTHQSFILVNGSTVGLLTAITAVTKKGDSILVA